MSYSSILIIYNPNATSGRALEKANELTAALTKHGYKPELTPTKHAGHAETLSYERASSQARPLIVSVSGDGGYNEVVNGVMRAVDDGSAGSPLCAVYPAGNANDHGDTVQRFDLAESIIKERVSHINVLHLRVANYGEPFERYAHSYAGFDFSGQLGHIVDTNHESKFAQTTAALRGLRTIKPVLINVPGKSEMLMDVFICANVNRMAKFLKLVKSNDMHDGRFNLIAIEHSTKPRLLRELAKIIVTGFDKPQLMERISFTLPNETRIQYDGEVKLLPAGSDVVVESQRDRLNIIR